MKQHAIDCDMGADCTCQSVTTTIETREVLAGAYVKRRPGRMLSHAVRVDASGREIAVFCDRVALDNLADRYASDPHAAPTCPQCLRALRKVI